MARHRAMVANRLELSQTCPGRDSGPREGITVVKTPEQHRSCSLIKAQNRAGACGCVLPACKSPPAACVLRCCVPCTTRIPKWGVAEWMESEQSRGEQRGKGAAAASWQQEGAWHRCSKNFPIWDWGLICIDQRDSDGALMWQCWACNDHRSISAIRCQTPWPFQDHPTSPASPAAQLVTLFGRLVPHQWTSSDTVIAVTAACSWCFTRAGWEGRRPITTRWHPRQRAVHRIVSYLSCIEITPDRNRIALVRVLVLVLVLVMYSIPNTYCTHADIRYGGGLWDQE